MTTITIMTKPTMTVTDNDRNNDHGRFHGKAVKLEACDSFLYVVIVIVIVMVVVVVCSLLHRHNKNGHNLCYLNNEQQL